MPRTDNSHDEVFPDRKDLEARQKQMPALRSRPDEVSASNLNYVHKQSQNSSEPELRLPIQQSRNERHAFEDKQENSLVFWPLFAFLFVASVTGAWWLGANGVFFVAQVPQELSPGNNLQDVQSPDSILPPGSTIPGSHRKSTDERPEAIQNTMQRVDIRSDKVTEGISTPSTNFEVMVDRIIRLDDEFSRLKVELIDLKNAEAIRVRSDDRFLALTQAISTGQMKLRTGRDPNNDVYIPMVYVSAGQFVMGQTEDQRNDRARASASAHFDFSTPAHSVHVQSGYFIGVYEVTLAQIAEFASQQMPGSSIAMSPGSGDLDRNKPASFIDWKTASSFCDWLSQNNDGITVRLPTEIEWEYAARGNTYIQQFESLRDPNVVVGGPWPTDNETLDRSWCGCVAMNSNVQEWTIDLWDERAYQLHLSSISTLPGNAAFLYKGLENHSAISGGPRSVRGSSFRDIPANRDPALRRFKPANTKEDSLGFRIVVPVVSAINGGQ